MADNTARLRAVLDDKVSGPLDRIVDSFDRLGGKGSSASLFGNVGAKAVAKGFDVIGDASQLATKFLFDSIDAASNLAEATSKSAAVFGPASKEMEDWASTAADSFGQSKRQALEAAGTFGNLLQSFGLTGDAAAEMSPKIVELASDLASFNNTSVDDALLALRSGLTGETEPLKRFGVAINDARLKEEALRAGLIKTAKGTLPVAIKAQAAYALILKDTALAQGDFDRTSDGLANTQKALTAELEDLQAKIGEELLPVAIDLARAFKDDVIPAVEGGVDVFKELKPILDDIFGSRMAEKTTELGKLDQALTDMVDDWIDLITPWDEFTKSADDRNRRLSEMAETLREGGRGAGVMASAAKEAERATEDLGAGAVKTAGKVELSSDRMITASRKLRDAFIADANAVIADYYEPIEARQELTALKYEAAEQRKIVKSKESTKEQIRDAEQRLTEINRRQTELLILLGATGDAEMEELGDAIKGYQKRWQTASKEARAEIDAIIRKLELLRLKQILAGGYLPGGGVGQGGGGRASGGPVDPNKVYVVGEEGPELFVSKSAGTIIPNDVLAGGSSGGTTGWLPVAAAPPVIHLRLYLDGREIAAAVEAAGYYEAAMASTATGPV